MTKSGLLPFYRPSVMPQVGQNRLSSNLIEECMECATHGGNVSAVEFDFLGADFE